MPTNTATEQSNLVVLKDAQGSYYVVPRAIISKGRISEERAAELEHLVGDDASGFITPGTDPLPSLSVFGTLDLSGINPESINNPGLSFGLEAQKAYSFGLENATTFSLPS